MAKDNITILEISSFIGIALEGEHYYGKLYHNCSAGLETVSLEYAMSSAQAKRFSKKDSHDWEKGDITGRFETRDAVMDVAVTIYKDSFPNSKALVLGNYSSVEPKRVLDAPKEIMEEANKIWEEYDKLEWIHKFGFYELSPEDEKRAVEMSDRFYAVLKRLGE